MNNSRLSNLTKHGRRCVCALWIVPLLLLLARPTAVQAQFSYIITNGTVTITGYTGPGGAVSIPITIVGLPVTRIGTNAFFSCSSLTSVTIPNSVTNIGSAAFARCTSLTSVTIGTNVTFIGEGGFNFCVRLTSVTIPNSVTSLGASAFYYCTNLVNATIGNGVTAISDSTFFDCTRLASFTIPNGVTSIGRQAFAGCSMLTSVTIPNSVTNIGDSAFVGDSLSNVSIPNSVISIEGQAFYCTSLTNIRIPNSVTSIGVRAFGICDRLNTITVDALNSCYSSLDGVLFDKTGALLIQYPCGKAGSYTIPNSVRSIGLYAFESCQGLTAVTLPNSVTSIGEGAFGHCTGLATVALPNSVTNIGDDVFDHCTSLLNIALPNSVINIGVGAFGWCTNLTNVIIPNSVTNIGNYAFYCCARLTSVTIPNSVVSIGVNVFGSCGGLTNVTMGNGLTSIGGWAFYECTNLTNVTIPNSVTNIGDCAFVYCSRLTSVTIPTGLARLGESAFYLCYHLTSVYFQGNAPILGGTQVFYGDGNATVYYLPGTTGWGPTFGGRPTALWLPPLSPRAQTAEVGSAPEFRVSVGDSPTLSYQWFFNGTSPLSCTNSVLQLASVQYSQAGAYTVIVSNAAGSVTSPPALLSVIAPVERRMVPGLTLMGQPGTTLNLDFTAAVGPAAHWTSFDHVALTAVSQWYFDLSSPLPRQGFYRAWQSDGGTPPALDLHFVPALTLTGAIGSTVRVDYINQFGPIDAWVTLDTVTLTSSPLLYFDTSSIGQPQRLWRIVPLP